MRHRLLLTMALGLVMACSDSDRGRPISSRQEGAGPYFNGSYFSYVGGKAYAVQIKESDLAGAPTWDRTSDAIPLSAAKAISLSAQFLLDRFPSRQPSDDVETVLLVSRASGEFYYVVSFPGREGPIQVVVTAAGRVLPMVERQPD